MDINMTGFTRMSKDDYRKFYNWITEHGQELYENKLAYETRWTKGKDFWVKLTDESIYTLDDIMLDIADSIV